MKFKNRKKFEIPKYMNIFNIRSFITMEMLCSPMNFRFIMRANNDAVETYCKLIIFLLIIHFYLSFIPLRCSPEK